jgi:hypothetical protein
MLQGGATFCTIALVPYGNWAWIIEVLFHDFGFSMSFWALLPASLYHPFQKFF